MILIESRKSQCFSISFENCNHKHLKAGIQIIPVFKVELMNVKVIIGEGKHFTAYIYQRSLPDLTKLTLSEVLPQGCERMAHLFESGTLQVLKPCGQRLCSHRGRISAGQSQENTKTTDFLVARDLCHPDADTRDSP